jgi:hypothetical protein
VPLPGAAARRSIARVLDLLLDGRSHDTDAMRLASPQFKAHVLTLTSKPFHLPIETRPVRGDSARAWYRLPRLTHHQLQLVALALGVDPARIAARVRGTQLVD